MFTSRNPQATPLPPALTGWLAVVVAGTLTLAAFAVPMKLSRPEASRRVAVTGVTRALPFVLGSTAPYQSSTVRIAKVDAGPAPSRFSYRGADGQQITAARIRSFLERQRSPMARYSQHIVDAGLKYRVDPRVVVAIAGVESTYGRYAWSYNAWGWGRMRWSSWRTAIDGYTQALSLQYRSLRTGRFAAASRTYCPPCGSRWGIKALAIFRAI